MKTQQIQKERKIIKGVFRGFSLKLSVVSFLFISALCVFALIIREAVYDNKLAFDNMVFHFFAAATGSRLVCVMQFFTFFGSPHFLVPAYALLVGWFIVRKKFRYGLHIVTIAASSTLLMFVLKNLTRRPRPEFPLISQANNYSFPSGHMLSAFIFCGIVVYIVWHGMLPQVWKWIWSVVLFLFATTVGISRIVLKVHYPTDVIASFCLGILWAILSLWIMRRMSKRQVS